MEDYIQLSAGIMDNSTARFSMCTWIKKRFSGSTYPVVLNNFRNIYLGDDGFYNTVAGTLLQLPSKYNRPLGTWFHNCWTWSNEDRKIRVYLDGHLIETSGVTERSELERGSKMCLGNRAYVTKHNGNVFGGDMFKLNIYNRVLTETEIKSMAADMCSCEEEKLASIKVLRWQDIFQYERSGNVIDIDVCVLEKGKSENEGEKLPESLNKTGFLEENLNEIMERLNNSEEELTESRNLTSLLEEKLTVVLERLNNSEKELTGSKKKTRSLEEKLTEVLGTLLKTEQDLEESGIARQQLKVKQGESSDIMIL